MDRLENHPENPITGKTASVFNRSLTIHPRTSPAEFPQKPSIHLLERHGSIKKTTAFDSVVSAAGNSFKGKVKKLCSLFESPKARQISSNLPPPSPSKSSKIESPPDPPPDFGPSLPGTEDRVVVYFTSLRGIRRTFEDCYAVRMIIKGFRVKIDERDISMDSAYRKELQSALGAKNVTLPQVFVKGRYLGGAEVVKQLNETGELAKLLKGLPFRRPGYVCEYCGDARFMPCSNCDGSRKVFDEDEGQLKRCVKCNENGLIRCPGCCS